MKRLMQMSLLEIYLDWSNNFLSTDRFAEYYQITEEQAKDLIVRVCEIVKQEPIIH